MRLSCLGHQTVRSFFLALGASTLLACAHGAPQPNVAAKAPPTKPAHAPPTPSSDYVSVFEDLLAKIDAHHAFATAVRPMWDARKSKLRTEFRSIRNRDDALVALYHLENALQDRHCSVSPPTDLRQTHLTLGLQLFAERGPSGPTVRVAKVRTAARDQLGAASGDLEVGDEVVAVDGVSVHAWLEERPFESNSLNPDVYLEEEANAITEEYAPWARVKMGDARKLTLKRGDRLRDISLSFGRNTPGAEDLVSLDDAPSMASIACRGTDDGTYAGLDLIAVGSNVCIYRPKEARSASTRVVRFLSFRYDVGGPAADSLRRAKADHTLLVRELANAKSVVLDLHENHGGNNPYVFLSWFARAPWDHDQVHVHVSSAFTEDETRQFLFGDNALIRRYKAAVLANESDVSFPFLCPTEGGGNANDGTCERKGPRETELVTRANVAVVTGPDCTSSCDAFVSDWSVSGLGPVVGQQPAHGYTTSRHAYAVVAPDGRDLGRIKIALSWEAYPRNGVPLEGAPVRLDWEAPHTFETRTTWAKLSLDEARRRAESMGSLRAPRP